MPIIQNGASLTASQDNLENALQAKSLVGLALKPFLYRFHDTFSNNFSFNCSLDT